LIAPLCRSSSIVLLSLLCVSSGWQPVLNSIFSLLYKKAEQLPFIIKKEDYSLNCTRGAEQQDHQSGKPSFQDGGGSNCFPLGPC
jgi:hypothetical protein